MAPLRIRPHEAASLPIISPLPAGAVRTTARPHEPTPRSFWITCQSCPGTTSRHVCAPLPPPALPLPPPLPPSSPPCLLPSLLKTALAWINSDPDDEDEATGSPEGNTSGLSTGSPLG